jgi:hypothetical protein
MKMIVRFRVDACLPSPDSSTTAMAIDDSDQAESLSNVKPNNLRRGRRRHQLRLSVLVRKMSCQNDHTRCFTSTNSTEGAVPAVDALSDAVAAPGRAPASEFIELCEWQLDGHSTQVDSETPRYQSWAQKGADVLEYVGSAPGNGSTGREAREGAPGRADARDRTCFGPSRQLQSCVCEWQTTSVCVEDGRGRGRKWEESEWELLAA